MIQPPWISRDRERILGGCPLISCLILSASFLAPPRNNSATLQHHRAKLSAQT